MSSSSKKLPFTTNAAKPELSTKKADVGLEMKYQLKLKGGKSVTWTSSNEEIATVSAKGKITALHLGKVVITAKSKGKTYKCKVTVKPAITSVSLNKTSTSLKVGKSAKLKATTLPRNASRNVVWTTSNKKVATVSAKGVVKALKAGKAVIKATAADGSKAYATCTLTVKKDNTANVSAAAAASSSRSSSSSSGSSSGGTVYWVASGEVYHSTPGCRSLARSHNISSGPLSSCPKSRPCKNCH